MNSSKRGPAYGFKLTSLDTLCDTKSANKKMSLLHYIQDTIRVKFPDLNNFEAELRFIEKASQGNVVNATAAQDFAASKHEMIRIFKNLLVNANVIY